MRETVCMVLAAYRAPMWF